MSKVTVSKMQIQLAKNCVDRLDKYVRMLDMTIELLGFAKAEALYNQLPDTFKSDHKRDIETILFDLKSLKRDAQEMAEIKSEKAKELTDKRIRQLEGEE